MTDYLFWLWGQITGKLRRYHRPVKICGGALVRPGDMFRHRDSGWYEVWYCNIEHAQDSGVAIMRLKAMYAKQTLYDSNTVLEVTWQ